MVKTKQPNGFIWIIISVLFAMLLMLIPLPDSIRFIRPEWVVMTLIYWALALPERIGVGFAWITGLFVDVLMGSPLGINAFGYALAIYFILRLHLQLRQYPIWQQAFIILSLVFLVNVIEFIFSARTLDETLILPALFSTLIWPLFYLTLRAIRRNFSVS